MAPLVVCINVRLKYFTYSFCNVRISVIDHFKCFLTFVSFVKYPVLGLTSCPYARKTAWQRRPVVDPVFLGGCRCIRIAWCLPSSNRGTLPCSGRKSHDADIRNRKDSGRKNSSNTYPVGNLDKRAKYFGAYNFKRGLK